MKKIIIAVALMLGMSTMNAQSFEKGTSVIQLGAAVGSDFGLPLGASYEYGVSDKIGVGVYAGYASKEFSVGYGGDYKVTYTLAGVRGNYHFYTEDKIDAYGGVLLGYNSASLKYTNGAPNYPGYVAPSYGGAVFGGQVGARYYFTDSLAAFAELGYGIGYLNIGLAYKL